MKIVSWNVNGLRAVAAKGFDSIFADLDADVFCLQETKLQEGQIDLEFLGYESYWNYADKKGYSGTAVYTRIAPLSVSRGIGVDEFDHEGRVVTLEFGDFFLVNVYTPNSRDGLSRLDWRMKWEDAFRAYLAGLNARKGVVVCGDMNVAHCEIDLKNPDTNHFNAGFSDEERAKMDELLSSGFIDTWREFHPGEVKYSWWSYRMAARERNVGWRIDYFLASEALRPRIRSTEIYNEIYGSDHCPVGLTIEE
ncbi:MAG: exodeoxyribonuclease III [Bacteroidales bacterium]|nr:exodeoxyribonuclease III [Bacteroidales bacterium]